MYLRSLKLAGFKSFADRTRLEFEPGVTVVVGPNGSGKSNLVEAIAWVMGTQAPSTVRTQRMDDVIFSGTATRPALGRSEVALTFDNGSRQLPLELDEVTITRRLYRDGTSEYEINGTGCRLLDIQELLSDSGVGRHQHVLVGQGQLDSVLNASPADHRAIIEEAAGVRKHRLRKERAERRLEGTDGDVVRLHDLLRELRRQMRPLRRQAEAAERHGDLRAEARALRLHLGGERLRAFDARLDELGTVRRNRAELLAVARQEFDEIESSVQELENRAGRASAALERDTGAAARLETAAERLRRIAQVAQERRRSLEARLQGAGERRRDLEEEARQLEIDLARSADDERRAGREAERYRLELQSVEEEQRALSEQEALPPEGAAALARGELKALETAQARETRELDATSRRLEVVRSLLEDESSQVEGLQTELRLIDGLASQAQRAYEAARAVSRSAQGDWDRTQGALEEARVGLAESQARLAALENARRGLADPAGRLRAAELAPRTLLEALDVPEDLELAVEVALGMWAGSVSGETAGDLHEITKTLRSEGLGGVGVVAPTREAGPVPARAVAEELGVDALVDRLGPGSQVVLAGRLLGDVVLVEGWSTGGEVVRRYPGIRAVTPEGDLITATGVWLADPDGRHPRILEAARAEVEEADVRLARARSLATSTRRSFEIARTTERAALECLESLETRTAGAAEALDRLERSRRAAREEEARLEDRIEALQQEQSARTARMAGLRSQLGALEGEEAVRRETWEALARRRSELDDLREEARRRREAAAAELAGIVERRRLLERRLSEVRAELQADTARPVEPEELTRLGGVEELASAAVEVVVGHVATLRVRQRTLRSEAAEAARALSEARRRLDELHLLAEEARSSIAGAEAESAGLEARREAEEEALRRELDAGPDEARSAPRPELEEGTDPEAHLERLEAELRRMGPVNPLAAEEFGEMSGRHHFLTAQLEDLERSRDDLRKVIGELETQMVELFRTAYEEVAGHFEENFRLLFPGGRGRLRLSEADHPIETGVEIEAQPLGKKVSRLSLLSGGERSLAALAFLFAVFEARPSPFYVLDEVDAALDDPNLRRFLRLVGRLGQAAQLVIVTHQQQTMEAADLLYGVTMEPGGSSKVVAKRMQELAASA